MLDLVIAINRSGSRRSIPDPFGRGYRSVEPGEGILSPRSFVHSLRRWGFEIREIDEKQLVDVLLGNTRRKRSIRELHPTARGVILAKVLCNPPRFSGLMIHFEQLLRAFVRRGFAVHLDSPVELPYSDFDYTTGAASSFEGYDFAFALLPGDARPAFEHEVPVVFFLADPPQVFTELGAPYPERDDGTLARASLIVTPSRYSRSRVIEYLGGEFVDTLVVPPALDIMPLKRERQKHIVLCGRLAHYKGIEDAIRILDRLPDDFEFHVLCPGLELDTEHPIVVYSELSRLEKSRVFSTARVGVVWSQHEGYGMVAGEMLLCGCPVVSRPIPAHKEIYGDALIYANNEEELRNKVATLLRQPYKRPRFRYTPPNHEEVVEEIWDRIRKRKPLALLCLEVWGRKVGGGELTHEEMIKEFLRRGLRVHVTTRRAFEGGTPTVSVPYTHTPDDNALRNLIRQLKPDLMYTNARYAPAALRFAKEIGARTATCYRFWVYHNRTIDVDEVDDRVRSNALPYFNADINVANSEFHADVIEKITGDRPEVFTSIGEIRTHRGLSYSKRRGVLISVVEGSRTAGVLRKVAERLSSIPFTVGYTRYPIRPTSNMIVHSFVENFEQEMRRHRVALFVPETDHTFGRFPLECAANGLPVVGVPRGNPKYYDFMFQVKEDVDAIVDAVERLYEDEKLWRRYHRRGLEFAKSWKARGPRELVDYLVRGFSRPASRGGLVLTCYSFPGVTTTLRAASSMLRVPFIPTENLKEDAEVVLVGAWTNAYLGIRCKELWVLVTSTLLQIHLDGDVKVLDTVLNLARSGRIRRVFALAKDVVEYFRANGVECTHLPCPVLVDHPTPQKPLPLAAGIFNTRAPRKNLLFQLAALLPNFEVYVNHTHGLEHPRIRRIDWLPRNEYLELMSKMLVTSQITFGESFNYTLLDSLLVGVPCMCPPWVPASRFAPEECRVDRVEDVAYVRDLAVRLAMEYESIDARRSLALRVRKEVSEYNDFVAAAWRKELLGG